MFLIPTLPTSRVIAETKNNIQVSSPVRDSSYIYISQILNEINVTIRITEAVPMAIPKLLEKTDPYQHKMWHRRSAQSRPWRTQNGSSWSNPLSSGVQNESKAPLRQEVDLR